MNIFLYAKLINYKPIYEAFGFMDIQPTFIGLIIVTMYISNPPNVVSLIYIFNLYLKIQKVFV